MQEGIAAPFANLSAVKRHDFANNTTQNIPLVLIDLKSNNSSTYIVDFGCFWIMNAAY